MCLDVRDPPHVRGMSRQAKETHLLVALRRQRRLRGARSGGLFSYTLLQGSDALLQGLGGRLCVPQRCHGASLAPGCRLHFRHEHGRQIGGWIGLDRAIL